MDKRKRDQKARLQPLKSVIEYWLETLMKEKDLVKQESFGNRKCIKSLKRKIKMISLFSAKVKQPTCMGKSPTAK